MQEQEQENGRSKKVAIAIIVFSICAALGIPPLELTVPPITLLVSNTLLIFTGVSLLQIVYVTGMVLSIATILQCGGGREFLERGRVGRALVRLLEHKKINEHHGFRWLLYETKYHLLLVLYGLPPLTRKIGLVRCALYPKPLAIGAVCLGSIIKVYLLIYPIKLGWKLLNGH